MASETTPPTEPLLWSHEVAAILRVDAKTVARWATAGRIPSIRTPGGHHRFRESEIRALIAGEPTDLNSVLAAARTRTGADYIAIDWATCDDDDGQVTVLLRRDGMSVYGLAETPSAALVAAEEKLRAHDEQHAGGAR